MMERSKSYPNNHSYSYTKAELGIDDRSKSFSFNGPSHKGDDGSDPSGNPELKRRKRVASYNMYTMEGKLKSSMRNSFKWIKNKFTDNYYDM